MSLLLESIQSKAKAKEKRIVLAEGNDERVIRAAQMIQSQGIAKITLLGDEKEIKAKYKDVNLEGVKVINPKNCDIAVYAQILYELRKSKGMDLDTANKIARDPLYLGVLLVKNGEADGMVAGAISATGDVLRPALQIIKTAPGITTVSSCFIMVLPTATYGENGVLIFGDCAVNPNPTSEQLAAIAIASAESAKTIAGINGPRVAMLSFSSFGSAKHEFVDKVSAATEIVKTLAPSLIIDGEMQADTALVQSVAKIKAPQSKVAGNANVLIFPDLQSGNIGYKLVQRLAGAEAIGPICQGFNKPVNDLSRGCTSQDILNVVAMTALQCK